MARQLSDRTINILHFLDEHGDLPFLQADPLLKKAGIQGVDSVTYSASKVQWKKRAAAGIETPAAKPVSNGHVSIPVVPSGDSGMSVEDALAFVKQHGSLAQAEKFVAHQAQLLAKAKELKTLFA